MSGSTIISMDNLPQDIILLIIKHACTHSNADRSTLRSLLKTCKIINKHMTKNMREITDYYTYCTRSFGHNDEIRYRMCGLIHRGNDLPAVIRTGSRGVQAWYWYGHLHRDNDKPATIHNNGERTWCQYSEYHRENDKPARIDKDGSRYWYWRNMQHRGNNQPAVIHANGICQWFEYNVYIRES